VDAIRVGDPIRVYAIDPDWLDPEFLPDFGLRDADTIHHETAR
jgi:hypothetical protein